MRDEFYAFGEIASVRVVPFKMCAFVTFTTRGAAEKAAADKASSTHIKGQRCRLMWGRPQQARQPLEGGAGAGAVGGAPGTDAAVGGDGAGPSAAAQVQAVMGLAAPGAACTMPYASMDPQAMGTRIPAPGEPGKRGAGGADEGQDAKRARGEGTGYGVPQGQRPPLMMPPAMPPGFPAYPMQPPPGYGPPPGWYGAPSHMPPPSQGYGMRPYPVPGGPPPMPAGGPPPQSQ